MKICVPPAALCMPAFASSNCSGPKRFPKSRSFTALMPVKWLISKE